MSLKRLVLAPLFLSTAVEAATVVKQSVETERDGNTSVTDQTWSIAGDKFQLEVSGQGGKTQFLFNGRTFYVCGQIDEAQIKAVTSDAKIIESYKSGACQVVPSNFMTRFFLSPLSAVETVDVSDGLKMTLAVRDYKLGASDSEVRSVTPCKPVQRAYVVAKSGEEQAFAAGEATSDESLCIAEKVAWRKGLFTEVAKTVLRQPGGGAMMQQLKEDMSSLPGFVVAATVTQSMKDKDGKVKKSVHKLTTTSLAEADVPEARFKIPSGYKIFSVEGLKLVKLDGPSAKAAAAGKSEDSLLDLFNSAVFCALAGQLGCFAN